MTEKFNGPPCTIDTPWPSALIECAAAFNAATQNDPWGNGLNNVPDLFKGTISHAVIDLLSGEIKAEQFVEKLYNGSKQYYKNK